MLDFYCRKLLLFLKISTAVINSLYLVILPLSNYQIII